MKKLILIVVGLACAGAFIGFDAVHATFDRARHHVRSNLMTPEMELESQISEAHELAEKCGESVIHGKVALARLDAMIQERARDIEHRTRSLDRDRNVLESRQSMLRQTRSVYLISNERVSRRTLNRDALLRANAYRTDRGILVHLEDTVEQLRIQRQQTAVEIESATSEQYRLDGEIDTLKAQLENLKARKAVAQTREESKYVFDRSAFDQARDKVATIRATIVEQNKRLDFYGRRASGAKGLIPAGIEAEEDENGLDAIASVLADEMGDEEPGAQEFGDADEDTPAPVAAVRR
jgi:chromosome segregation ATPase